MKKQIRVKFTSSFFKIIFHLIVKYDINFHLKVYELKSSINLIILEKITISFSPIMEHRH